ncbi:MAG: hypothetical protein PF637_12325 [Spirochaetes bacterium]|jgi:hypothetical protein|nr:hypothetical protein [Spirochaetota bacterium]
MNNQRIYKLILLVQVLFQTSCVNTYYHAKKNIYPNQQTKVVVIAGMFDKSTTNFAELLTQEFEKKTKFSMIPQKSLKRSNKYYPIRIKGPFSSSFYEIEDDYTLTDKESVLMYARSVKADYVYVVWVPVVYAAGGSIGECSVIGQMFDVRTGEEIGNGKYSMYWFTGTYIGSGAARTHEEALKQGAGFAVREIAEKMKVAK